MNDLNSVLIEGKFVEGSLVVHGVEADGGVDVKKLKVVFFIKNDRYLRRADGSLGCEGTVVIVEAFGVLAESIRQGFEAGRLVRVVGRLVGRPEGNGACSREYLVLEAEHIEFRPRK